MIDMYDKVLKEHISQFLKIGDAQITLLGLSTEDSHEQVLSIVGAQGGDAVAFPIVSVVRLPSIEISDSSMTKRQLNYSGYALEAEGVENIKLNAMRCDLKYSILVFAPTRKVTEDLATQLYFKLRNINQIKVNIRLPLKDGEGMPIYVQSDSDIVLDPSLTQVRAQQQNLAQMYLLKFNFTLKHCYIFDFSQENNYNIEYQLSINYPQINEDKI
jgi:hypothetical protein